MYGSDGKDDEHGLENLELDLDSLVDDRLEILNEGRDLGL